MKRIKTYVTAALLLFSLHGITQQKTNKYLIDTDKNWYNIGDQIKDVVIQNIRNYPSKSAKISDFKGKLLILDFWSKGCSSCISAFPKMEALQKEFQGQIQILLVCKNSEEELKLLFQKSPNLKAATLPMPLGDTVLNNLFPHTGVPYHVWIGPDGKVVGMTDGGSTNATNIKEFLETGKVNLPLRKDAISSDLFRASLIDQLLNIPDLQKYVDGGVFILKKTPYTRPNLFSSIPQLIESTFIDHDISNPIKKTIVEVKDTANISKYFPPINPDLESKWDMNNQYKIQISPLTDDQRNSLGIRNERDYIRKYLKEYILSHFGITYAIENRNVRCWVMKSTTNADNLKSKGKAKFIDQDQFEFIDSYSSLQMDGTTTLRNVRFKFIEDGIISASKEHFGEKDKPVFFNETGYDDSFKIDADIRFTADLTMLNKEIAKYGLYIKEEHREVKCLVIKEL